MALGLHRCDVRTSADILEALARLHHPPSPDFFSRVEEGLSSSIVGDGGDGATSTSASSSSDTTLPLPAINDLLLAMVSFNHRPADEIAELYMDVCNRCFRDASMEEVRRSMRVMRAMEWKADEKWWKEYERAALPWEEDRVAQLPLEEVGYVMEASANAGHPLGPALQHFHMVRWQ